MKRTTRWLNRFLLLTVFILILASLADVAAASAVAKIKQRKKLVMLCYPHPLSTFVKQTGEGQYEGLDVYIMKTFSNSLGVALEVHPVSKFEDLIPELLAGNGDVIASSFSITQERAKRISYSEPYFPVVVMVLVRKESTVTKPENLTGKKEPWWKDPARKKG